MSLRRLVFALLVVAGFMLGHGLCAPTSAEAAPVATSISDFFSFDESVTQNDRAEVSLAAPCVMQNADPSALDSNADLAGISFSDDDGFSILLPLVLFGLICTCVRARQLLHGRGTAGCRDRPALSIQLR